MLDHFSLQRELSNNPTVKLATVTTCQLIAKPTLFPTDTTYQLCPTNRTCPNLVNLTAGHNWQVFIYRAGTCVNICINSASASHS